MYQLRRFLESGISRLEQDERGAVAILAGLMFPVLIGGMGLGVEAGYWYYLQRRTQHAADVSSFAAAVRKTFGDNSAAMKSAATNVATASGFAPGTVTLQNPPSDGGYVGDNNAVRVILERSQPRMFSAIFATAPVTIRGRSVASLTGGGPACVLALSRTAANALRIAGSSDSNLTDCSAQSNAGYDVVGSAADFDARCFYSVTGSVAANSVFGLTCGNPQRALPAADPFASIPEPNPPPCESNNSVGGPNSVTRVSPGYYCNGLTVKGDVVFEPGVYVIDGDKLGEDLAIQGNVKVSGSGVTFFFKGMAAIQLTGKSTVNLSAPTSGTYSGILFFGNRSVSGVNHMITGTSGSSFVGAIYTPASTLTFRGDAGFAGGCTQIVANEVDIGGNANLQTCDELRSVMAGQVVRIVE